jgi:hypothetical protein
MMLSPLRFFGEWEGFEGRGEGGINIPLKKILRKALMRLSSFLKFS